MKQVYSLQRQQRKHGLSATTAVSLAEPTRLFAPATTPSSSALPYERQERPAPVAQFKYSFDRISIRPPVPDGGAGHEVRQSEMQQTGTQLPSVQGQETQRQPMFQEGEPLQKVADPGQAQENKTGMPDALKARVETLSGLPMDDVRVHFNSSKPAQVDALAYAQGTEIHVGPGQERHLAHEAWHVAQQKQGRVQPTLQAKGVAINDDAGLEKEADVMGTEAIGAQEAVRMPLASEQSSVVQRVNGAVPVNFRITTQVANNDACTITTGVDWDSSTGNRNDLSDVAFREQVTFPQDPRIRMPGYDHLLNMGGLLNLQGNVLTKEGAPMSNPGGSDTHTGAAWGLSFTVNGVPNLQQGNWTLIGNQFYQYRVLNGGWTNLHNVPFTITRTMQLVNNVNDDHYELTLQKQGPGVNLTAGPTRINFETTQAMAAHRGVRPNQTADWNAAHNAFTQQNLILQDLNADLNANSTRQINNSAVTFEYNSTGPSAHFNQAFLATVELSRDWEKTILTKAQSAVETIIKQVLNELNHPPTRFKITIFRANQVRQQSFWTNEGGVSTYRVLLRADKLMDKVQWGADLETSIPGRETRRGWTDQGKKERMVESTVVHELGHMLQAFANPDMFISATLMPNAIPANGPLRPEKVHIATINGNIMNAIVAKNYKAKWMYARANPAEVVAEVFTALIHGRNVPRGLAAVYVSYGGVRTATIDKRLKKSFDGTIPTINQPEGAIPFINQNQG